MTWPPGPWRRDPDVATVTICADGVTEVLESGPDLFTDAVELEKALGIPYWRWRRDLAAGSPRALQAYVWLLFRRNGREITLEEAGALELDLAAFAVTGDDGGEGGGP
jgi:hypothetical protein